MFPWLPFLNFPESQLRLYRRNYRKFHNRTFDPSSLFITKDSLNYEFRMEYVLDEQLNSNGLHNKEKLDFNLKTKATNNLLKFIPTFECSISLENSEKLDTDLIPTLKKNETLCISKTNYELKEEIEEHQKKSEFEKIQKGLETNYSTQENREAFAELNTKEQEEFMKTEKKSNQTFIPSFERSISLEEGIKDVELDNINESFCSTINSDNEKKNIDKKIKLLEAFKHNSFDELTDYDNKTECLTNFQNKNLPLEEFCENTIENTVPEDPIINRLSNLESSLPFSIETKEKSKPLQTSTVQILNTRKTSKAFETSSAMLELFGIIDSKKENKVQDINEKKV